MFFQTILAFTRSRSYRLDDIDGLYQLIAGSYKSDKHINNTRIDKVHLKSDCINESIVNDTREPILYSFTLSSPTAHKLYQKPKVKFFKKISKSVISHITFYSEDDDHKAFDFNGETIPINCQKIEI